MLNIEAVFQFGEHFLRFLEHPDLGLLLRASDLASPLGITQQAVSWNVQKIDSEDKKMIVCDTRAGAQKCLYLTPSGCLQFLSISRSPKSNELVKLVMEVSSRPPSQNPVAQIFSEAARQGVFSEAAPKCSVYAIQSSVGLIKVGRAKDIRSRFAAINSQSPVQCKMLWHVETSDAKSKERELHKILSKHRTHGEWFNASIETVRLAFQKVFKNPIKAPEAELEEGV